MSSSFPLIHILDYQDPSALVASEPTRRYSQTRQAARAVVRDSSGRIYLLHVTAHGYYKLPGGGIEPGEDIEVALLREVREEIGGRIRDICPLGRTVQFDNVGDFRQDSYCFLAQLDGQLTQPELTDDEAAAGFQVALAGSLPQAIELLSASVDRQYAAMTCRDAAIIRFAQQRLSET